MDSRVAGGRRYRRQPTRTAGPGGGGYALGATAGTFPFSYLDGGTSVPASTWAGGNSGNLQYIPFADTPVLQQGTVYALLVDASHPGDDGDAVSYTFTGTGIAYVSEKSDGYGLVDVYLDGQREQTVDANAAGVHNQGNQVLFAKNGLGSGPHTLTLVKKSGVYMLLDALVVTS